MLACLYGASAAPFVEPVVADLQHAAAKRRIDLAALTLERVLARGGPWDEVEGLYVLPFEMPPSPSDEPTTPSTLVRSLFPRARVLNSTATHEVCFDKLATTQRLLARGVPMPSTLMTSDPEEAREFARAHGQAILKEPRSCAGQGHLVLLCDEGANLLGESLGRRYLVELQAGGEGRRLSHGVLEVSPPFLLQRLVTNVGRGGRLVPAQILRAYIVDGQVVFWTERYRAKVRTPSDFIVSVALGARYRFLPAVSEEARKIAMRAAEVLDMRIGVVDLVRDASGGASILELDTDGAHMFIDRSFKLIPDFRPLFDFDDYIAEMMIA